MNCRNRISLLVIILIILAGCADKAKPEFQKGMELQQQYKYENAIAVYDSLVGRYPNSIWADSAKKEIEFCKEILQKINDAFEESSNFLKQKKYDEADARIQEVLTIKLNKTTEEKIEEHRKEIKNKKAIAHANLYGPPVSSVKYIVTRYVYVDVFKRITINIVDDNLETIRVDTSWFRVDSSRGSHTVQKSGIEVKEVTIQERFSYNDQKYYYPLEIAINYVVFDTDGSNRVGWENQFTKFFRVNFAKNKYGNWEMIDPDWHYLVFLRD